MSDLFSSTIDADYLSGRLTESIVDAVKAQINDHFVRQEVQKALNCVMLIDGEHLLKQGRVNGESFNMIAQDDALFLSKELFSLTIYPSMLDKANSCVKKLFDNTGSYLGSFIYISKSIGICTFHSVVFRRKVLDGSTLILSDHRKVKHFASYPYYDISLYQVISDDDVAHLDLSSNSSLRVGAKIFVAAFPALDGRSSQSSEEEVLITPGRVVRMHATVGSEFAAGAYACCRGYSGGAVLDEKGNLLGMHVQNLYALDDTYYRPWLEEAKFPEDYVIKSPTTHVKFLKENDDRQFKQTDPLKLARHAATNISEKSSFGCFLPVAVIRRKLEAYLIWAADNDSVVDVMEQ